MLRSVQSTLGFMNREGVAIDTLRSGGVLRAPTRPLSQDVYLALEKHECRIHDCADPTYRPAGLARCGFDTIDLSHDASLQALLERIRRASRIGKADIRALHGLLRGRSFNLANGNTLRVLFVASEGTIMRIAGPNGLKVNPDTPISANNDHDGAAAVHIDQDVRGTPVRQILRRTGPLLLHHDAPDGANRFSPLFLLNLWIPLQQTTRPLALMDTRTIDRKRHQLRYALPVESFLDRHEDMRLNDIWSLLHDGAQQWYFTADMDPRRAYVFDTLSTPHGAFVLPGEDCAERLYQALQACCRAARDGDRDALLAHAQTGSVERPLPGACPEGLRRAIDAMAQLLDEAALHPEALLHARGGVWIPRVDAALDRVVRKSVELRLVAWVR